MVTKRASFVFGLCTRGQRHLLPAVLRFYVKFRFCVLLLDFSTLSLLPLHSEKNNFLNFCVFFSNSRTTLIASFTIAVWRPVFTRHRVIKHNICNRRFLDARLFSEFWIGLLSKKKTNAIVNKKITSSNKPFYLLRFTLRLGLLL